MLRICASKFKYSEIQKFKLSSAETKRKRKRALDNAQKAKKKNRGTTDQDTRSVKGSLQKQPLSADEAHTDVFKSLRSQSHYNSLLFLHKNGCFSNDLCPQVDELLE